MGFLTKEERDAMRDRIVSRHYRAAISGNDMLTALDTIDALEAELLHADARFENELYVNSDLYVHIDALVTALHRIRVYAQEHSTTRVIGGAHAALRKIADMAGGGE